MATNYKVHDEQALVHRLLSRTGAAPAAQLSQRLADELERLNHHGQQSVSDSLAHLEQLVASSVSRDHHIALHAEALAGHVALDDVNTLLQARVPALKLALARRGYRESEGSLAQAALSALLVHRR